MVSTKQHILASLLITAQVFLWWPATADAALRGSFDTSANMTAPADLTWTLNEYLFVEANSAQIQEYDSTNEYVAVFADLSSAGATSLISIDYDPTNERILALDIEQQTIYVVDEFGDYVDEYDISGTVTAPFSLAWDNETGEILVLGVQMVGELVTTIYEFNDEGTPTGTSFTLANEEVGFVSGFDAGGGSLWVTSDTNWNIQELDRNDGSATGIALDISAEGDGNPSGLEYVRIEGFGNFLMYIDTSMVYLYDAPSSGGGAADDDSYLPTLGGWFGELGAENTYHIIQGMVGLIAIRFPLIDVDQGATISSATLRLTGSGQGTADPGTFGVLYGNDIDDAPAWDDLVHPDTMATTTASTPFTVVSADAFYQITLDVTDIVQEIVNRPGWQTGSAIAFGGSPSEAESYVSFWSSEGANAYGLASLGPQLVIETADGGGEDPPARVLRLMNGIRLMNGVRLY